MKKTIVTFNGKEIPDALCLVNTASNIVTLETMDTPCMKIDLDKAYVAVSIHGKLIPLEDEED